MYMNRQFKNEIRNKTSRQLDAKIRQNVQTKDARKLKFGISPSYLNNNQHYSCIQFIRYLKVKTRVHPKNKSYYTDFLEKIYKIDYSLGNGHFYSVFNPRNKKLEIILPISFPSKIDWEKGGIPNQYKDASRELKNEEQKLFMRDIKILGAKTKR